MCPTFNPVGVQVPLRGVCLKIVPRFCRSDKHSTHTPTSGLKARRGPTSETSVMCVRARARARAVCVRVCVRAARLYRLEPAHVKAHAALGAAVLSWWTEAGSYMAEWDNF